MEKKNENTELSYLMVDIWGRLFYPNFYVIGGQEMIYRHNDRDIIEDILEDYYNGMEGFDFYNDPEAG